MLTSKEYNVWYINSHRDWFHINKDYQRDEGIWSLEDKRQLIDTILKDLDIPKIYLRQLSDKRFEIVDGQQRIKTIWEFKDNKFSLDKTISGGKLDGMYYKDLPADMIDRFDNFGLTCVLLIDYDDEKTRELFSKLQRGKPLNPAEKLNAYPGKIVPTMRKIGSHDFFNKVNFPLQRYKSYHLAAKLMLLEDRGITDVGPQNINDFFMKEKDLDEHSSIIVQLNGILNYLNISFSDKTPELSSDSWIINIYLLVSNLMKKYVMKGREKDVFYFFIDFWKEVENSKKTGIGDPEIVMFSNSNSSGTTSKKNIEIRFSIITKKFVGRYSDLQFKDPNRYFDHYEKVEIFRRDKGICQACGIGVKWDDYEADHIIAHTKGGITKIENGQVLCKICNGKKGSTSPFSA